MTYDIDSTGPEHSRKDPRIPNVLDPRLAQARSLRELARDWHELSVICRRIGARIERIANSVLYEAISISTNESTNDNPNQEPSRL